MPDDAVLPTSKQWMIPYFTFFQLHAGRTDPSRFLTIRAIHNKKPLIDPATGREKRGKDDTETLFNENLLIADIRSRWLGLDTSGNPTRMSLYQELLNMNLSKTQPANIYFGVNPRLHKIGNKKEHVEGFCSLYLDMDSNKGYTKEQRWMQIQFLIDYGFAPTFVIGSGDGYHVYWVLSRLIAAAEGEALEKHLIELTDCKAGGNVADVTRILRLPGFYNVKKWYEGHTPVAGIVYPANFMEAIENKILLPRHEIETFKHFPPCSMKALAEYKKKALTIHPYEDDEYKRIMREIVLEHGKLGKDQQARLMATEIQTEQANLTKAKSPTFWEPTLKIVPPLDDIKWPRGRNWLKKYIKKGYEGLTAEELTKIEEGYACKPGELSASELDSKIIYALITLGYTHEAVREFWLRPEHKTYRPEKESRSPTYFADTYAKMLESAQNAFLSGEAGIKQASSRVLSPITIENYKTYTPKGPEGMLDLMLNSEFLLRTVYEDLDCSEPKNQEWYDIEARVADPMNPNGYRSYMLLFPRAAFNSLTEFKNHCYDRVTLTTDKPSNLQRLLAYLLERYGNVERNQFRSKITYQDQKFIFPTFTITKTGFEKGSIVKNNKVLQRKFFAWDWVRDEIAPREEVQKLVRDNWRNILHLHLPRVVCSILGIIGAAAIRPRFENEKKIDDFHLPAINIRGDSSTGKSESVILLSTLTGISRKKNVFSTTSSQFALHRMMHVTNFIPIVIDEFKEDDGTLKNIEMVRDLVRRSYTGEAMIKGRADLSVDVTHIHGAIIVVGETDLERIGNIAETSRVLPITASEFKPVENYLQYLRVSRCDWTTLGPYFYQFVLGLNLDGELITFDKIKQSAIRRIADSFGDERLRVGHNLATIIYGCSLWTRFIHDFAPSAPSMEDVLAPKETLIAYMRAWALSSGQNMRIHMPKDKRLTIATPAPAPTLPEPTSSPTIDPAAPPAEDTELVPTIADTEPVPDPDYMVVTRNELLSWVGHIGEMVAFKKSAMVYVQDHLLPVFKINKDTDELLINFSVAYSAYQEQCILHRKLALDKGRLLAQIRIAEIKSAPWFVTHNKPTVIEGKNCRALVLRYSVINQMGLWIADDDNNGTSTPTTPTPGVNRISNWFPPKN
jgi:hypothetical protein